MLRARNISVALMLSGLVLSCHPDATDDDPLLEAAPTPAGVPVGGAKTVVMGALHRADDAAEIARNRWIEARIDEANEVHTLMRTWWDAFTAAYPSREMTEEALLPSLTDARGGATARLEALVADGTWSARAPVDTMSAAYAFSTAEHTFTEARNRGEDPPFEPVVNAYNTWARQMRSLSEASGANAHSVWLRSSDRSDGTE